MNCIRRQVLIVCAILYGLSGVVSAQKYNFKTYSVNEGLPHSQVTDIAQGDRGYMWIGTLGGGLSRFNGTEFTNYDVDDGLKDNIINSLYVDSEDDLWVTTWSGGVAQFQGDSLVYRFREEAIDSIYVWRIEETDDGSFWFQTNGSGIFIRNKGEWSQLTEEDGLANNTVWDIREAADGKVWIATQNGLSVYDGQSFTNYRTEEGLSGNKVYRIVQDREGRTLLATDNGLSVREDGRFTHITSINGVDLGYVFDLLVSADGTIWIGTENRGVFRYRDGVYRHFREENGLSSNFIYCFYEDRNERIWIGTNENGLSIYSGEGAVSYGRESGLSSEGVLSVLKDSDGTIWAGTEDGLFSFREESGTFEKHDVPIPERVEPDIWELAELPGGELLVLANDNTLWKYDGREFTNYSEQTGLSNWYIYDLLVDSEGTLWIGTDEGLFARQSDGTVQRYTRSEGLSGNVINYIYEDDSGNILVGTTDGLSRLNESGFETLKMRQGLGHSVISYITQDQAGNYWLGTGGGITLYRPDASQDSALVNFGKAEGMVLVDTHFLWFDASGMLWQGTNAGIHKLDVPEYRETGEMEITHHPVIQEGLGLEFNHKALVEGRNGSATAWFGSMKGLLKFEPDKMDNRNDIVPVFITAIMRNGRDVSWEEYGNSLSYRNGIPDFGSIVFPYDSQSLTFEYAGLDFLTPESIRYEYMLRGFEDEWMPMTANRSATYTNLGAGDYEFVVRIAGSGDGEELSMASYSFSVNAPFWATWWFYALMAVLVIALGYTYIQIRVNYLDRKKLEKLVEEQTRDITKALEEKEVLIKEIHHRVKNNLAVISGLLELQMGYTDNDRAIRTLSESQRRVQSIAMIHEKLYENDRLSEINFGKYVKELVEIISYSFSNNGEQVRFDLDIDEIKLGIDQAISCGLILNELVSNSFEHAFGGSNTGKIAIDFRADESNITFRITDNGPGLPEDIDKLKNESLGLILVETLVGQLEGKLDIQSSEEGTSFIIEFERKPPEENLPV